MPNPLAVLGHVFLSFLGTIGRLAMFTAKSIIAIATPPFYWRLFLQQVMTIGYYSLPVVGMTALFTGAVLALQIYLGSARFGAESAVPNIVVVGLTRELGPVLAGLMLGGRVGAAIAAELGTMKVTEQLTHAKRILLKLLICADRCIKILYSTLQIKLGIVRRSHVKDYILTF